MFSLRNKKKCMQCNFSGQLVCYIYLKATYSYIFKVITIDVITAVGKFSGSV